MVEKSESGNGSQDGGKITVRTAEERKYVDMLLDVLRGANEQWKHALMMTIVSAHQYCNEKMALDPSCLKMLDESEKRQAREEPEKQQTRKTLREKIDEFDSEAINTLEYGFHYVNGVLATTQRITEGETEQMPADFYWVVDEARERLDKIRGLLGFLIEKE